MKDTTPAIVENMADSMNRKPLQENPGVLTSICAPISKKLKTSSPPPLEIYTFSLSHSPVQVQLLGTQSIYALVDIICQETCVGDNESVDEHMWDVKIPGHRAYNSLDQYVEYSSREWWGEEDSHPLKATKTKIQDLNLATGTSFRLEYDYGTTSTYEITLVDKSIVDKSNQQPKGDFPRRKPLDRGFIPYVTDQVNLNHMFPHFNAWLNHAEEGFSLECNFFQPGRKHMYGYFEHLYRACLHMIYLPLKPGKDLSDYLHCIDHASQFPCSTFDYGGTESYPNNTWYSMVALPHDPSVTTYEKFLRGREVGFCDARRAPTNPHTALNAIFPKVAALAGYKKDHGIPRGWISYKNKVLRICTGQAMPYTSHAPKFTACVGSNQYQPSDPELVLREVQVEFESLHHLFCVAEGLLQSM